MRARCDMTTTTVYSYTLIYNSQTECNDTTIPKLIFITPKCLQPLYKCQETYQRFLPEDLSCSEWFCMHGVGILQGRLPERQCLSVGSPSSHDQACYAAAAGSWVVPILLSIFCCPHSLDKMLNLGIKNGMEPLL